MTNSDNQIPLTESPAESPAPVDPATLGGQANQNAPAQNAPGQQSAPAQSNSQGSGEMLGAGAPQQGQVKDPEEWVTGDQPMTDAQRGYLDSLARQAGEQIPADLTKAQASEHIDRLQAATGQNQGGQNANQGAPGQQQG